MLLAAADTDAAESAAAVAAVDAVAVDVGLDMGADGEGLGSLGVSLVAADGVENGLIGL